MTYEGYRIVFNFSLVLAFVFLALTIMLFYNFDIRKVIGDLTGINERRAIESIRTRNKDSANRVIVTGSERLKIKKKPIQACAETTVLSTEETIVLSSNEFIEQEITFVHSIGIV